MHTVKDINHMSYFQKLSSKVQFNYYFRFWWSFIGIVFFSPIYIWYILIAGAVWDQLSQVQLELHKISIGAMYSSDYYSDYGGF